MKTQILPNWCKKLGITLFIVFSFISGLDDFIDGFNSGKGLQIGDSNLFKSYFGENLLHYFSVISIIGMIIYMLSKEKIEDDYINKLRLESYQLTAIIGLIISLILYGFSENLKFTLDYFISLFMYFYLITFFIKKRLD
jgi:hypothetical protein